MTPRNEPDWLNKKYADEDGKFRRPQSAFRSFVSPDAGAEFPAEAGRYLLYRAIIVRKLKSLEDIVELVEVAGKTDGKGWTFDTPGPEKDPLYGFKYLRELYEKAAPDHEYKYISVPVLWDKNTEREIEDMNDWVYNTINNGVYKSGFAATQQAYEENHLANPAHQPYLFGANITEADIRLFTTMIRFDVAYYSIFKCNLKMIRHDYPRIHTWLRTLYWDESERTHGAFKDTTRFDAYKLGYSFALGAKIVPVGPVPNVVPL
ncbi:hypothetical protein EJ08DRAFT_673417 [Tothia fuscella]|uniref:GST C-terminal domain-containing protein n=1 Tax=Tothia fuscella TaxID=1048955 RepID=A0A9P4NFE3_9PEZI|nr:hypothetical protein EJ08DRAFT_673417 [Tothia fuscella]